jgi:hypothetical protein
MTIPQESKFNMYGVVDDYLTPNSELTKDLPEYPAIFGRFQIARNEIHRISELQNFDKTGFAKEKKQLRDVLYMLAYDNSQKLTAFANLSNNKVLHTEVRFTKSNLKEANETLLKDYAQMVYDRAQTNLGSLGAYGITQETQSVLLNAINAFNASVGKPRLGVTEKSDATKQLAGLFKECDMLLEKIDLVINILMLKEPNFYNRYKDVRKIIVTGTGSLALKATAVELHGGIPVRGAKFTFVPDGGLMAGNGGNIEIVKKTAEKGNFYIKSMPEGIYKVRVTKTGYKEKEVTISVAPGELADLSVEMEKI